MRLLTAVLTIGLVVSGHAVDAQRDPQTALLEKTGWDALAVGDGRQAADAFRAALAADPMNARLHLGAGAAAYLERRDAQAKSALERALSLAPRLSDARRLLGRVLYRMGDHPGAIRIYEELVATEPDDRSSGEMLARWRRESELHQRMQQNVNERFTVLFEGPEQAEMVPSVMDALDRAYWHVGDVLGGVYPNSPVTIVLYTTEQFRDITRSPAWAAAAFDGRIRIPMRGALGNAKELDRVLSHEYTHAVVWTLASRNVPAWLNEGLATVVEADGLDWAERLVPAREPSESVGSLPMSFSGLTGERAQMAYATSALAVRRMLDEAGGFAVTNLLRDLGAGEPFDAAFLHRMQRPFAEWVESR